MCGIWASIGCSVSTNAIERVAHRGPDGAGWFSLPTPAGPLCLGHRLLAITSGSDERQPLAVPPARNWLTYNGEIYYGAALRVELERAGHAVRGSSDTALVLAALGAWGLLALERMEGMFALAYFDAGAGRLLVARDRFGIKPLFMHRTDCGVAFASEIRQFLALPAFRGRLNAARARDFLELGITDHTAETLWQGVVSVPPATAVIAEIAPAGGISISEQRWYRLPEPRAQGRDSPATDAFATALRASVAAHVPDDAPAGISLSGGLDSSALACLMPRPLPCISLAHEEPGADESRYAQAVARHIGSSLHLVRLAPEELPAALAATVHGLDEPFPSLSVLAQWAVFREARRLGIKVLITGQGADELLGGYPFLLGSQLAGLFRSLRLGRLTREIRAQRRLHGRRFGASAGALATALAPAAWLGEMTRRGIADRQLARARLAITRAGRADSAGRGIGAFRRDLLGAANLAMLLRYEDRTAMAHGIEARPPFLDRRVVETALAIDGDELVFGGVTKQPLRAAAGGTLPTMVLERTDKRGFPTPESAWLKGPLRSYVLASARAARARFPELVGADELATVESVLSEPGPLRAPVWRLGSLGAWAGEFDIEA